MKKKRIVYWIANVGGWLAYVVLSALIIELDSSLNPERAIALLGAFAIGIALSHLNRAWIIRSGWLEKSIPSLLPRLILSSILFGVIFFFLHTLTVRLFSGEFRQIWDITFFTALQSVINWSLLGLFWSVIYFAYHFFENARKKEIENLRWEASKNEMELENLKRQLNPHFMFNSMNSIRALIDEDPEQAKTAVTQLSQILRNTLLAGKKKTIPLEEEMQVVNNFLDLEKIRYEERLEKKIVVPSEFRNWQVPPLLLQTIVENSIKHGIAKRPEGGTITIQAERSNEDLELIVKNTGELDHGRSYGNGIGLENSRKRLRLLFGEKADLKIDQENGEVRTLIRIPGD